MSYWQIISLCLCLDIHLFCLLWSIYQRLLALLLLSSFQGCSICFTAKAVRFRRWIRITQYPSWAQCKTNCGLWNNRSATFKRILKKLHFRRRVIYHLSYEKTFFLFIYHKYGNVKFYKRDNIHHSTRSHEGNDCLRGFFWFCLLICFIFGVFFGVVGGGVHYFTVEYIWLIYQHHHDIISILYFDSCFNLKTVIAKTIPKMIAYNMSKLGKYIFIFNIHFLIFNA